MFSDEQEAIDLESTESDQSRTTRELVKAMCSLVNFLQFEGEDSDMFENGTLPTLDTALWWDGSKVSYEFFEKPTCPNRTIQKSSALSQDCVRASLCQEFVRRLSNCHENLSIVRKQEILSNFCQKIINSGHSINSCRYLLVHGATKYIEKLKNSKLPMDHKDYQPLHFGKDFNRDGRKLKKFLAKSGWYSQKMMELCQN